VPQSSYVSARLTITVFFGVSLRYRCRDFGYLSSSLSDCIVLSAMGC